MLASALNFLSDKRRRIHRSDTMPIFSTNPPGFKLDSDMILSKDQCESINASQLATIPMFGSNSKDINDDNFRISPKSQLISKAIANSESQSPVFRKASKYNPTILGNNRDQTIQTECQGSNLPKCLAQGFSTDDIHSSTLSLSNQKESSQTVLSKYLSKNKAEETLNQKNNLQGESPSTSDAHALIGRSQRETQFAVVHLDKDYKDTKDKGADIENESYSQQSRKFIATSSGKSRMARMRAKAVARAAKGKLKRSKSSVHMSRNLWDNVTDTDNVVGYMTTSRVHIDEESIKSSNTDLRSQSKASKKDTKSHRSRSVTSPRQSSTVNPINAGEIALVIENLKLLAARGDKNHQIQIDAFNQTNNTDKFLFDQSSIRNSLSSTCDTNTFVNSLSTNTNITTSNTNSTTNNNSNSKHAKRTINNRKLRRNNSSMTCTNEKLSKSDNMDEDILTTNSTAGDLLLPAKNSKLIKMISATTNEFIKYLSDQLFTIIKQDDYEELLKLFHYMMSLDEITNANIKTVINDFDLSPLECAFLTASANIVVALMVNGFQIGPILKYSLNSGPTKEFTNDTLLFHLTHLLNDTKNQLNRDKMLSRQAVCKVNELAERLIDTDSNQANTTQLNALNSAFADVSLRDKAHLESLTKYEYVRKLLGGLDKFSETVPLVNGVFIFCYSADSLLIKIYPPKLTTRKSHKYKMIDEQKFIYNPNSSCDTSENEMQDTDELGRRFLNDMKDVQLINLILHYRIEWSFCPKFLNSEVYHCIVSPPIRSTILQLPKQQLSNSALNVGFYVLRNLPVNQMIYIRVFAFSIRGWSEPFVAYPQGTVLSSWYESQLVVNYRNETHDNQFFIRFVDNKMDNEIGLLKQNLTEQLQNWSTVQPAMSASNMTNLINTQTSINSLIEDTNKRNKSPLLQRKRSFRFLFSNKGMKFYKQTKSGIYLTVVCHTKTDFINSNSMNKEKSKCKIVLIDDNIPILNVTKDDNISESNLISDFNWFSRLINYSHYDLDLQILNDDLCRNALPTTTQLRLRLLETLQKFKLIFGISTVDCIYPEIIRTKIIENINNPTETVIPNINESTTEIYNSSSTSTNSTSGKPNTVLLIVLLKCIENVNDLTLSGNLKWCALDKFLKQNKIKPQQFSTMYTSIDLSQCSISSKTENPNKLLSSYPHLVINRPNQIWLSPESQLITSLDSLFYYSEIQARKLPPGLYVVLVQMKANLDQQPTILISTANSVLHMLPTERVRSRSHVSKYEWDAVCNLVHKTNSFADLFVNDLMVTEQRFVVRLIKASLKLANRLEIDKHEFASYRLYLPEIISISPTHSLIPIFPPIDQVCLPPNCSTNPPVTCSWVPLVYLERHLGMKYDPVFQKHIQYLLALLDFLIPISQFLKRRCLAEPELTQSTERTQNLQLIQTSLETMFQHRRWLSEIVSISRDRKRASDLHVTFRQLFEKFTIIDEDFSSNITQQFDETLASLEKSESLLKQQTMLTMNDTMIYHSTTVIQVYAAYHTGLPMGTSVRLLINAKTTVKEIIDIAVNQLMVTAQQKSKYHASSDYYCTLQNILETNKTHLKNCAFCLTVSTGLTQRCLPDDLHPMRLKKPWRFGKFTIHLIDDLLDDILCRNNTQSNVSDRPMTLFRPTYYGSSFVKITIVQNYLFRAICYDPPTLYP